MQSFIPLLNLAKVYLSSAWIQAVVAIFVLSQLALQINKTHRVLRNSARSWAKTGKAVWNATKRVEASLNRMMGYREDRPPRPLIDATILAGDVMVYWLFSGYLFTLGSVLILLVIAKQSHDLRLILTALMGTLVLYVCAAIYRNLGAQRARRLSALFKHNADNRRRQFAMAASIAAFIFGLLSVI
ncbi:hypothetical protein PQR67_35635 [Paraburkholderia fungorum]|uniref:hypothetical protein n=1 Tax=Paraburkholderia fungorum TaxID=134537 RepID=UPI0038BB6E14